MTHPDFLSRVCQLAATCSPDELDGLLACVEREMQWVERVRRLKAEAPTQSARPEMPTLDEKIGPDCFGGSDRE